MQGHEHPNMTMNNLVRSVRPAGASMGTGQAPVKAYNRFLCKLIQEGKATPSFIVSHELALDEAADAYEHFDAREEGWTKVVLKPHMH